MNYKKGSFMWAVEEMKKGRFVRKKKWIKGLFVFSQFPTLIGDNPYGRIYRVNIFDAKFINLDLVNLNYSDSGLFFTGDFEGNDWISKKLQVKGGKK